MRSPLHHEYIARCVRRDRVDVPWADETERAHAELSKDPWFVETEPERLERLRAAGQAAVP